MRSNSILFPMIIILAQACGFAQQKSAVSAAAVRPPQLGTVYSNDAIRFMDVLASHGLTYGNVMEGFATMQADNLQCRVSSRTSGNIVCNIGSLAQEITGEDAAVIMQTMSKVGSVSGGAHAGRVTGSFLSANCKRYENNPAVSSCTFTF